MGSLRSACTVKFDTTRPSFSCMRARTCEDADDAHLTSYWRRTTPPAFGAALASS